MYTGYYWVLPGVNGYVMGNTGYISGIYWVCHGGTLGNTGY